MKLFESHSLFVSDPRAAVKDTGAAPVLDPTVDPERLDYAVGYSSVDQEAAAEPVVEVTDPDYFDISVPSL